MIPESEGSIFLCLARGSCLQENTTVTLKEENPELCRHCQPQVWSCSQIHRDGQGACVRGSEPTTAPETLKAITCLEWHLAFLSLRHALSYPHLSPHCCQHFQSHDKDKGPSCSLCLQKILRSKGFSDRTQTLGKGHVLSSGSTT